MGEGLCSGQSNVHCMGLDRGTDYNRVCLIKLHGPPILHLLKCNELPGVYSSPLSRQVSCTYNYNLDGKK